MPCGRGAVALGIQDQSGREREMASRGSARLLGATVPTAAGPQALRAGFCKKCAAHPLHKRRNGSHEASGLSFQSPHAAYSQATWVGHADLLVERPSKTSDLGQPRVPRNFPSLVAGCFSGASSVRSFPLDSSHCVDLAICVLSGETGLSKVFEALGVEGSPLSVTFSSWLPRWLCPAKLPLMRSGGWTLACRSTTSCSPSADLTTQVRVLLLSHSPSLSLPPVPPHLVPGTILSPACPWTGGGARSHWGQALGPIRGCN